MSVIDRDRLREVMDRPLRGGSHEDWQDGACLLEAVAYVAGEPWSDHPACVSPVLAAFGRAWNDDLDDTNRQRLRGFVPRLVGTAGDGRDEARSLMALDWLARVHAPAWMDLTPGLASHAEALRALNPIASATEADAARTTIDAARDAAGDAAWDAARDAAWDAARAATWDAARDAARDATWAAAGDATWAAAGDAAWAAARDAAGAAAWDATWDAAWAAAGDAAWDAAWDAAGAATWDALAPTRAMLIEDAFDLYDRMIEGKP